MRVLNCLVVFACSALLAATAWAAEPGMYRPGNAYFSKMSSSPDQCAALCRGDGTCQGWNYVTVRPSDSQGVCELNARRVAPVPSAVSISGDNTPMRVTAHLVPSGMRTVRVGTVPTRQAAKPVRVGNVPSSRPATRRVVKTLPPPQQQKVSPAAYRRPEPQQQATRTQPSPQPQFQHSLDSAPARPAQHAARPQAETPKSHHTRRLQELIANQKAANLAAQQKAVEAPAPGSSLPPRMPKPTVPENAPAETVQQSLFGSLYDDVKAPKALGPEDIPDDVDAPIATVASVPTKKITVDNMMAGAAPNN